MKKILLICCMVAATNMLVFGQAPQISKSEFTSKVNQLNKLLDQNKAAEAKTVWEDVHTMMMASMSGIKSKMNAAVSANNTAEKDRLAGAIKNQFAIYSGIIKVRDNLVENKAIVKTRLNEFAAGM